MRRVGPLRKRKSQKMSQCILFFDAETHEEHAEGNTSIHQLIVIHSAFVQWAHNTHYTEANWRRAATQDEFIIYVYTLCKPKKPLTMIAHKADYDMVASGMVDRLKADGWKLTRSIISCPPTIMVWRKGKLTIKLYDSMNYTELGIKALGKSFKMDKLVMPDANATPDEWDTYCKQDVAILMRFMLGLFAFIRQEKTGGFAATAPAIALNAFKRHFLHHNILIDMHEKSLQIAREGFYGGRCECFAIGDFTGDFYYVDINSMYPFVMRNNPYPNKRVTSWRDVELAEAQDKLERYSMSAYVQIETDEPAYAVKGKHRLIFPTGLFDAYVQTADLRYGLNKGHIKKIYKAVLYDQAPIFVEYVDYWYSARLKAQGEGDNPLELFCKLMLNSLYGKFGQVGRTTIKETSDPGWLGLSRTEYDDVAGREHHWYKLGGVWQSDRITGEAKESFPAIAAHVTSYARQYLWSLICQAGIDHVYYCDTDSLFLDAIGFRRLAHLIDKSVLGLLKLAGESKSLTVVNPKWYDFGSIHKCKGVRRDAVWMDNATIVQQACLSLKGLLQAGNINNNRWVTLTKKLDRTYKKGHVLPDGRTEAYTLPRDQYLIDIA